MRVLKSSLPPQFSGETGTTSFRKKKKKFLEFQAPWNYFVRQELSSEALRFQGGSLIPVVAACFYVYLAVLGLCSFVYILRTTSSSRPVRG